MKRYLNKSMRGLGNVKYDEIEPMMRALSSTSARTVNATRIREELEKGMDQWMVNGSHAKRRESRDHWAGPLSTPLGGDAFLLFGRP